MRPQGKRKASTMALAGALAGLLAFCVAGCSVIRPDHGDGVADIPATEGGFAGAAEGSPGNAMNIGSNRSTVISGVSGRR